MALAVLADFPDKVRPCRRLFVKTPDPEFPHMNVTNAFLGAVVEVTYAILDFYVWALIIGAVLSWLVAFGVLNQRNRFVQSIGDLLFRITEPALRPIRSRLPPVGGVDLSPLVLIFAIIFIQSFLRRLVF